MSEEENVKWYALTESVVMQYGEEITRSLSYIGDNFYDEYDAATHIEEEDGVRLLEIWNTNQFNAWLEMIQGVMGEAQQDGISLWGVWLVSDYDSGHTVIGCFDEQWDAEAHLEFEMIEDGWVYSAAEAVEWVENLPVMDEIL